MALSLILACTLIFAACGTKPAADGGGTSAPPANGDAPAPGGDTPAAPPAKAEVTLVLTQHDPDASLPGQYCFAWAEMVAEKSGGKIKVEVNNGGSIAKPTESLDMVRSGAVDLAWGLQSFYPDVFPMTDGLTIPYLPFESAEQASRTMMDIFENTDYLTKEYADYKVILLRTNNDAPLVTTTKTLDTVSALSGLTMRATGAPILQFLSAVGAKPEGVPINELYSVLQNGSFDGCVTDWHGINSFKIYEVAKKYADEKVLYNTYYFLMNKAVYDGLSDELKAVIDECSGQAALDLMLGAWDDMTASTKETVAENGGEVYTLPDAEHAKLVAVADQVRTDWISGITGKGYDAQGYYDAIIATAAKYK
jgi:TRAP-type C4-dicarboxylate transport system substrate-binding protein